MKEGHKNLNTHKFKSRIIAPKRNKTCENKKNIVNSWVGKNIKLSESKVEGQ